MATVAYGSLPFQQQIAFFRNKKNVLTESWLDLWQSEHDNGFMVAGANRIDLLADFNDAVRKTIADGATLEDFRRDFDRIVARHGWDYNGGRNWRSRVIYETNLRQSYSAGRWQQEQQLKKARPWKRYRHNDAVQHPRPVHLGWDNKIWAVDDPVWRVIHPQNGWGCKCYTETLSDRDLKRLGKTGPDPSPELEWIDVTVGQRSPGGPRTVRTVVGIDPGFAYAPGSGLDAWPARRGGPVTPPSVQRSLERSAQDLLQKSTRLPATTAADLLKAAMELERARDALQAGYAEFQAGLIALGQARNTSYAVGALDADLVAALGAQWRVPSTAAIVARDADVLRVLAEGIDAASLVRMPGLLRTPDAVLLDRAQGELIYLVRAHDDYRLQLRIQVTGPTNAFRNALQVDEGFDVGTLAWQLRRGELILLRGSLN